MPDAPEHPVTVEDLYVVQSFNDIRSATVADLVSALRAEDAARLVERLLPGECENCQGDPHKIDGWTCHVCHGTGQVWDEGIVEAVAKAIHQAANTETLWDGAVEPYRDDWRREARAVLSAIAQLAEAGSQ